MLPPCFLFLTPPPPTSGYLYLTSSLLPLDLLPSRELSSASPSPESSCDCFCLFSDRLLPPRLPLPPIPLTPFLRPLPLSTSAVVARKAEAEEKRRAVRLSLSRANCSDSMQASWYCPKVNGDRRQSKRNRRRSGMVLLSLGGEALTICESRMGLTYSGDKKRIQLMYLFRFQVGPSGAEHAEVPLAEKRAVRRYMFQE